MQVVLSNQSFPLRLTTECCPISHRKIPSTHTISPVRANSKESKAHKPRNSSWFHFPTKKKKKKNYRLPPDSCTSPGCSHWFSQPGLLLLSTSNVSCLFLGLCLRCFPFSLNCSLPWEQRICSACHAKCSGHVENFLCYKTQKILVQWEDRCIDLSPASSLYPGVLSESRYLGAPGATECIQVLAEKGLLSISITKWFLQVSC